MGDSYCKYTPSMTTYPKKTTTGNAFRGRSVARSETVCDSFLWLHETLNQNPPSNGVLRTRAHTRKHTHTCTRIIKYRTQKRPLPMNDVCASSSRINSQGEIYPASISQLLSLKASMMHLQKLMTSTSKSHIAHLLSFHKAK